MSAPSATLLERVRKLLAQAEDSAVTAAEAEASAARGPKPGLDSRCGPQRAAGRSVDAESDRVARILPRHATIATLSSPT